MAKIEQNVDEVILGQNHKYSITTTIHKIFKTNFSFHVK